MRQKHPARAATRCHWGLRIGVAEPPERLPGARSNSRPGSGRGVPKLQPAAGGQPPRPEEGIQAKNPMPEAAFLASRPTPPPTPAEQRPRLRAPPRWVPPRPPAGPRKRREPARRVPPRNWPACPRTPANRGLPPGVSRRARPLRRPEQSGPGPTLRKNGRRWRPRQRRLRSGCKRPSIHLPFPTRHAGGDVGVSSTPMAAAAASRSGPRPAPWFRGLPGGPFPPKPGRSSCLPNGPQSEAALPRPEGARRAAWPGLVRSGF